MSPREAPDIDSLYTVPLESFIAERNRVAKDLAEAGDDDAAGRVKALRKPSVTAWALNQLSRSDEVLIRDLIASGARMKSALDSGDRSGAREAQAARRAGLKAAGDRAKEILETAGHASGPQVEKIRSILLQASTDQDVANAILEGRLSKEPEPDALPDAFADGFSYADDGADEPPRESRRVEKLRALVDGLRADAEAAADRSTKLARQSESARLAAEAAEENARAAERAAERALKHLEDAQARLREALD